jgi:hypothetical protein
MVMAVDFDYPETDLALPRRYKKTDRLMERLTGDYLWKVIQVESGFIISCGRKLRISMDGKGGLSIIYS